MAARVGAQAYMEAVADDMEADELAVSRGFAAAALRSFRATEQGSLAAVPPQEGATESTAAAASVLVLADPGSAPLGDPLPLLEDSQAQLGVVPHAPPEGAREFRYIRPATLLGVDCFVFRGHPDKWHIITGRGVVRRMFTKKQVRNGYTFSESSLPCPQVVRAEAIVAGAMGVRKGTRCISIDFLLDALADAEGQLALRLQRDWEAALASISQGRGGLPLETGVVGAFIHYATPSQAEAAASRASTRVGQWQVPDGDGKREPPSRNTNNSRRAQAAASLLGQFVVTGKRMKAVAADAAALIGAHARARPVSRPAQYVAPVYTNGRGRARVAPRLHKRRYLTGCAGCYACQVAGRRCVGRQDVGTRNKDFVRCRWCAKLGLTERQCTVPLDWLRTRPSTRVRDPISTAAVTCHICAALGPFTGSRQCALCRNLVCPRDTCITAARLRTDVDFFVCCHCLGVPHICGCQTGQHLTAFLLLRLPLPEQPPRKLLNASTQPAPLTADLGFPEPAPANRWLYEHVIGRRWKQEEHEALSTQLQGFRTLAAQNESDPVAVAAGLVQLFADLPWSRSTVVRYLVDLAEDNEDTRASLYGPASVGGLETLRDPAEPSASTVVLAHRPEAPERWCSAPAHEPWRRRLPKNRRVAPPRRKAVRKAERDPPPLAEPPDPPLPADLGLSECGRPIRPCRALRELREARAEAARQASMAAGRARRARERLAKVVKKVAFATEDMGTLTPRRARELTEEAMGLPAGALSGSSDQITAIAKRTWLIEAKRREAAKQADLEPLADAVADQKSEALKAAKQADLVPLADIADNDRTQALEADRQAAPSAGAAPGKEARRKWTPTAAEWKALQAATRMRAASLEEAAEEWPPLYRRRPEEQDA